MQNRTDVLSPIKTKLYFLIPSNKQAIRGLRRMSVRNAENRSFSRLTPLTFNDLIYFNNVGIYQIVIH